MEIDEPSQHSKELPKLIAFYLPQYHPIPENDEWWGKGFTEWTNVAKARPLFKGHYQPHIPADLGFYDLRVPETREQQSQLAKYYGIYAFCYYHYWFSGKQLLHRPFEEVLRSGEPKYPFCLCWANETWTGVWHGSPNRTLIEQSYPGLDDHERHFYTLFKAFSDNRYVLVDGKPIFIVYKPQDIPEPKRFIDLWKNLAIREGLKGIHFVGVQSSESEELNKFGLDAIIKSPQNLKRRPWISKRRPIKWLKNIYYEVTQKPTVYKYSELIYTMLSSNFITGINYPCVVPNWDNTPRSGYNGVVLHNSTPELFRLHLKKAISIIKDLKNMNRIIFVKSWNEWAEGNHLEPDLRYGHDYLKVVKDEIFK